MKVISLGWGTQSFAMAAMSALGELPHVDVAVFADTTHEREATYRFAERWAPWLREHGVTVVTVTPASSSVFNASGGVVIPAFTASRRGGLIQRQCTGDWKIDPIKRWLQANRDRQPVELWIGISLDEITRMKPSTVKYITHRWPLVEQRQRRADLTQWLIAHDLEIPGRSACTFCPYQSRREWREMQGTPDWDHAVAVDAAIRTARPPFDLFVHRSMAPLPMADFRSEQEKGQMDLWDAECTGHCGL